ncbi:Ser-Thr-rich glycosyl-phosphatidyl-inositol-anchored membrane family-domain-containing protein [Aspergillus egyptiacus]|nr:Ser-Thr-rich glycosyl-phosphatidyl-inositol-anchored membrane family-domain-containing protein [Aspergillus egyptiacus]
MHFTSTLTVLTAFVVSTLALTITSPATTNQKVDFSKPFTIRWETVPSDPEQFTITLVNMDGHNVDRDLAKDVDSSDEEYTIEPVDDVPIANNYQINFRSTVPNNMGILAQSARFNVTKVAEVDRDNATTTTTTTTTTAATTTETDSGPTETNEAAGVFSGYGAMALVMGLAALAL